MRRRLALCWVVLVLVSAACGEGNGTPSTTSTPPTTAGIATSTTGASTTPTTASASPSTSTRAEQEVAVWFTTGDGTDCGQVSAFPRRVGGDGALTTVRATLDQLVAGPTAGEGAASSFFSAETVRVLRSVGLDAGLLVVDFEDLPSLIPNASSSCGSEALLAQLNATVLPFESVDRVRYEVEGSCDAFSNWLQRGCTEYSADGAVDVDLSMDERASGSGCSPGPGELGDGWWFGYVAQVVDDDLAFDLACWFTGEAAADGAAQDGEESPPPNDYYVRNESDRVRSVTVAPAAVVTWLPDPGDPATVAEVSFGAWVAGRQERADQPGVWLTITDGAIVAIEEQYVP